MRSPITSAYWIAYQRFMTDNGLRLSTISYLDNPEVGATIHDVATEQLLRRTVAERHTATAPAHQLQGLDPTAPHDLLVDQWLSVPRMSREGMRSIPQPAVLDRGSALVRTGGSTGEPVGVVVSRDGFRGKRARLVAARTAIGWRPGMPIFSIWGSERDIGNSDSLFVRTQRRAAGIHFDAGFTTSSDRWHRLADLMERQPDGIALYGYSTLLGEFARTLQGDNRQLRPGLIASVWNGAEPVDAEALPSIEFVTGTRLHNFYGARETGAIAVELHRENAPGLTVVGPEILLEVVDESGVHVAPGEVGKVLVSVLVASGTPIVRYEIGDFARAGTRTAFGHASITEILGRTNDSIPLPGGGSVYGIFFNHLIKDFPSVGQFQALVSASTHTINLRVVPIDSRNVDDELDQLRAMVEAKISGYSVQVTKVDGLDRTAHGKLRQVIVQ